MNEDIVKKAACFIPGGSALSQDEREAAARAILALYPTRDIAVSIVDTCEFSSDPTYHATETVIADALGRDPVQYNIGDQTAGLTNLSDLQAVMDAVEKALTVSPTIEEVTPTTEQWESCETVQDRYDLMKRLIRQAVAKYLSG